MTGGSDQLEVRFIEHRRPWSTSSFPAAASSIYMQLCGLEEAATIKIPFVLLEHVVAMHDYNTYANQYARCRTLIRH